MKPDIVELEQKANSIRQTVLEMALKAGTGHIAPAYSCTDILVALYHGGVLRVDPLNPDWEERDRFILSKGHACAAQYALLADLGFFPEKELASYCQKGGSLGGHSESDINGVEASTGSLGHGLSIGAGMALAGKMDKKDYIVTVLMGDGELQEGSTWEAVLFSSHWKLNNLVVIIDRNRLQALDFTEQVTSLEPLDKKWQSFGWETAAVNGHSMRGLLAILRTVRKRKSAKPLVIIANTTKGKGVSLMEEKPIWHARIPQGAEVAEAREELDRNRRRIAGKKFPGKRK